MYICTCTIHFTCIYVGRAVIRKYCNFLWKSFPKDYPLTLARFDKEFPTKIGGHDRIATYPNLEMGNLKILSLCIIGIQKDSNLFQFCTIMEKIIDNPKVSKIMKVLRKGKTDSTYICTYISR